MKPINPFKALLQFIMLIVIVMFLSSCSNTTHGYNYSAHARKNKSVGNKTLKRNAGRNMLDHRCTNKR